MSKIQKIIAIILSIIAIASIAATIFIIISNHKSDGPIVEEEPSLDCPMVDGTVTYSGQTDKTALDILASICEIETRTSADGNIITVISIDGITATAPDYWALYINDAYARVSPNNLKATETDTIKWQLESLGK
ncbi:DUF4430 domain-containing protein [Candidatus Saccharibacteria bacterium]|nr:DUF4430 domain-containing protein [Candidatus Saccharibacteria bacterium]